MKNLLTKVNYNDKIYPRTKKIGGHFMEYLEKTQVYNLPLSTGTKNLLMRKGYTDIIQLLPLDYEGFKKFLVWVMEQLKK